MPKKSSCQQRILVPPESGRRISVCRFPAGCLSKNLPKFPKWFLGYNLLEKLTPELLRLFIQKIVVHEKSTKWSKKVMQTIEIHYNDIGFIGGDIQQDKENPRQEISA